MGAYIRVEKQVTDLGGGSLYAGELIHGGLIYGILRYIVYCNKIKKTTFADMDLHYFTSFIFKQVTILFKKATLQKKVL